MKYYKDLHNLYFKEVLKEFNEKYDTEFANRLENIWFLAHNYLDEMRYTNIFPCNDKFGTVRGKYCEEMYEQNWVKIVNNSVRGFRSFPLLPSYRQVYELLEPSAELGRLKAPYIEIMKYHNLPYTKNMSVATMKTRIIDFAIKKWFNWCCHLAAMVS